MNKKPKIARVVGDEMLMTLEELLIKATAMGEGEGYEWPRIHEEIAKTALKKANDKGRFRFEGISYVIESLTYKRRGYAWSKDFSYKEYLKMGKPTSLRSQQVIKYTPINNLEQVSSD